MDEEKAKEASNEANNPLIEPSATSEYVGEAEDNIPNTKNQTKDCSQKDKEACKPVVNIYPENNKPQKRANFISWVAVGVNAVLALFTYLLFLQNSDAIGESKRANTISQNALDDSRFNDSINRRTDSLRNISDSIKDDRGRIKDSLTIDLANKSLGTQISSIKETQKQFEIENRPLMQIADLIIDTIGDEKVTVIRCNIVNMGKFPAKVFSAKFGVSYGSKVGVTIAQLEGVTVLKDFAVQTSIAGSFRIPVTIRSNPLTNDMYENYKNRVTSVYVVGEVGYKSIVAPKIFYNKFVFRITTIPTLAVDVLKNDDIISLPNIPFGVGKKKGEKPN
jgi:hypothetical protein